MNQEAIELVKEAQEYLLDAIQCLKRAGLSELDRRTVIASLEIIASRNHTWLSRDRNLDDIIDELEAEIEIEDEDESEMMKDLESLVNAPEFGALEAQFAQMGQVDRPQVVSGEFLETLEDQGIDIDSLVFYRVLACRGMIWG